MKRIDQMRRRAARWLDVAPLTVAPPRGVFSLSFDDIPESAWTEAGPILAERGVKATYYVCGGFEGGVNLDRPQYRTEHLQALFAAGHEVGCHTYGHDNALRLTPAQLADSLDRNAAWVAERLDGHVMTTFAYPFGECSLGAKRVVRDRFALGRGVRDGINRGREDRGLVKAIGLEKRRLPGYDLEALMARTAAEGGWLIAYGHDVSDDPTDYGCTPEQLDRVIRLAQGAGLEVTPVGAALGQVASPPLGSARSDAMLEP